MNYTIKEGRHSAFPPTLGLFIDKQSITKTVSFDDSCRYTLADGDQEDVNKLFGIGYFWSHHTDSARFGWRYNPSKDKIELLAYCYVNGERVINPITDLDFNKDYNLTLNINPNIYTFYLDNALKTGVYKTHNKRFGFPLGPYFGGNKPAPHKITIKLN